MNSFSPYGHTLSRRVTATGVQEGRQHPIDARLQVVASESLFRGAHEIGIEHEGSMYRLKITRQGKLILNK
ncbi:hemin uptake protein HemP [Aerobium aerolatum]|uniref:Hemin uptake protein hemP n=1 Tax=Aquamicrobium aerolatum DSM 21857 TaxID=1121003 RepID=A0A1I3KI34_9HYPH|nr:Hemin uptake protein hemP [Aquamicrobium aerolatum DSM 21857]